MVAYRYMPDDVTVDDCRAWNDDIDPVAYTRERAQFKESVSVLPVGSRLQFEYPPRSRRIDIFDAVTAI